MTIQLLNDNHRWENNQTGLTLKEARRELQSIFNHDWNGDGKMQDLDDLAFDVAGTAEVGQVITGATGRKWRIVD